MNFVKEMKKNNILENIQTILILGLGQSGFSAAKLAVSKGYSVFLFDEKTKEKCDQKKVSECEQLGVSFISSLDWIKQQNHLLIVVSPGIPLNEDRFKIIREHPWVVSEIQFAWQWISGPTIAITGTNGKSTTTALIEFLLVQEGINAIACGNFGLPLSETLLDPKFLHAVKVVELSSFQLENIQGIEPDISLCLEITEDHLNRYDSFNDYEKAKLNLFTLNSHWSHWIIHHSILERFPDLKSHCLLTEVFPNKTLGEIQLWMDGKGIHGDHESLFDWDQTCLSQPHNRSNCLFAICAIFILKGKLPTLGENLMNFKGLHFRQEKIHRKNGDRR